MFQGQVVELDSLKLEKLNKRMTIAPEVLNEWDKQQERDIATPVIKELVQWLYPQPQVLEFAIESVADQVAKIDMVLDYPQLTNKQGTVVSPARTVGFQIKSSAKGAQVHFEKNSGGTYHDGMYYPCPGVFWCTEVSLESLVALANFTNGCVHPDIDRAIDLVNKVKATAKRSSQGLYHDVVFIKKFFNPYQWLALQRFKVVFVAGGRMFYP